MIELERSGGWKADIQGGKPTYNAKELGIIKRTMEANGGEIKKQWDVRGFNPPPRTAVIGRP